MDFSFYKSTLTIIWMISIAMNTLHGGIKAFTEYKCLHGRPGSVISSTQHHYLTRVNNKSPNLTLWDFDYLWLSGSSNGKLWKYYDNGTYANKQLENSVEMEFYGNKKYYTLKASVEESKVNIPVYFALNIKGDDLDTPDVSEYGVYPNSTTYLKVTYVVRSRECKVKRSFNEYFLLFFLISISFPVIFTILYSLPIIGYPSALLFKKIVERIPLVKWGKLRYFCNEITNEPVHFNTCDPRVRLIPERSNLLHGEINEEGIDFLRFKDIQVCIDSNDVYVTDFDNGRHNHYVLENTDQFRRYLSLIKTNHKLICLNERGTHYLSMFDILDGLTAQNYTPSRWKFWSRKTSKKVLYYSATGSTLTANGNLSFSSEDLLYTAIRKESNISILTIRALIAHNRNFFSVTLGNDSAVLKVISGLFGYNHKPCSVKSSQWSYYLSDVWRLFVLYEQKFLPISQRMGASKAFLKTNREVLPVYKELGDKQISLNIAIKESTKNEKLGLNEKAEEINKKVGFYLTVKSNLIKEVEKYNDLFIRSQYYFRKFSYAACKNLLSLYDVLNSKDYENDKLHAISIFEKEVVSNIQILIDFYDSEKMVERKFEDKVEFIENCPLNKRSSVKMENYKRTFNEVMKFRSAVTGEESRERLKNDLKDILSGLAPITSEPIYQSLEAEEREKIKEQMKLNNVESGLKTVETFSSNLSLKDFFKSVFKKGKNNKSKPVHSRIVSNRNQPRLTRKKQLASNFRVSKAFGSVTNLKDCLTGYINWLKGMGSKKATFASDGTTNRSYKRMSTSFTIKDKIISEKTKRSKNKNNNGSKNKEKETSPSNEKVDLRKHAILLLTEQYNSMIDEMFNKDLRVNINMDEFS